MFIVTSFVYAQKIVSVVDLKKSLSRTTLIIGTTQVNGDAIEQSLNKNKRGFVIIYSFVQNTPFNYATYDKGQWIGGGVAFKIIDYLKSKFEFDYVVKPYNAYLDIFNGLLTEV